MISEERLENSTEVEIGRIHSFRSHPFKVLDDDRMDELVKSIRENGVLSPVLIRPDGDDSYEMISGHRRLHASQLAGLEMIPAIIRDMSNEEATIAMVDANIQREELLPSEKAFAYKMKMEAIKSQGTRTDRTSCQNGTKLGGKNTVCQDGTKLAEKNTSCHYGTKFRSDGLLAQESGNSARQVQRYIRLTYLIPEILELVDRKKFPFMVAVEISYIDKRVQRWVYEYHLDRGPLRVGQIKALRKALSASKSISEYKVMEILNEGMKRKEASRRVFAEGNRLDEYFSESYTVEQMEEVICSLLQKWSEEQKNSPE